MREPDLRWHLPWDLDASQASIRVENAFEATLPDCKPNASFVRSSGYFETATSAVVTDLWVSDPYEGKSLTCWQVTMMIGRVNMPKGAAQCRHYPTYLRALGESSRKKASLQRLGAFSR